MATRRSLTPQRRKMATRVAMAAHRVGMGHRPTRMQSGMRSRCMNYRAARSSINGQAALGGAGEPLFDFFNQLSRALTA